jgi:DNA-binding PadR family transcriptional regulator
MGDPLSNTSAAVLGLVAMGARSGYEISRAVDRSLRFFWALAPPQIYAELKRLDGLGLIEGRDEARGARRRRVYDATPAGAAALRAWVTADADPSPLELRDPELLRLFFAGSVGPAGAVERVEVMRRRSERMLEAFRRDIEPAAERAREGGHELPQHVARFGRELHEFVVDWCARVERELAEEGRAA